MHAPSLKFIASSLGLVRKSGGWGLGGAAPPQSLLNVQYYKLLVGSWSLVFCGLFYLFLRRPCIDLSQSRVRLPDLVCLHVESYAYGRGYIYPPPSPQPPSQAVSFTRSYAGLGSSYLARVRLPPRRGAPRVLGGVRTSGCAAPVLSPPPESLPQ